MKKLLGLVSVFVLVSIFGFSITKGDDCSSYYTEFLNCSLTLTTCLNEYSCNNINQEPCNLFCSSCDSQNSAYQSCIQGLQGGTQTCDGDQPDGSGNCLAGYRNVSNCCVLACEKTGEYLSGMNGNEYDCQICSGDTVPNVNHTKCVCDGSKKCCGIQLNTVVPFIGDCIEMNTDSSNPDTTSVTSVTAFPILMQGLMKLLMSAIMIFSFMMVIIAGLSITTGAFGGNGFTKGKTILKNVIISLILLGCSGLILSLINPSFFGG